MTNLKPLPKGEALKRSYYMTKRKYSMEVFYTVGTDVLGCPKRTTAGAVPGRNYKLLPALATNSPPDYSLHASRHPPYDRGQKCMTKLNYPIYTLLLAFN